MNYIFTFIGEFGYELLNWQGVIRKWSETNVTEEDKIIICSRQGLEMLYEFCNEYIVISHLTSLKSVVADCYTSYTFINGTGLHLPRAQWEATRTGQHITDIKDDVINLVKESDIDVSNATWIWSCDYTVMNGHYFGLERPGGRGGIYNVPQNQLNLDNNRFVQIHHDESKKSIVENKLGFSLDEEYLLCQTGFRQGYELSKVKIDHAAVLAKHRNDFKIVLMDFNTGRLNDSFSRFDDEDFTIIKISNLAEQSVLIQYAKKCIFFTEGHLRSHTYLPPMFGRDVDIIADEMIFSLHEAPLDFWNTNVFQFGGQMNAIPYREVHD
ncbi:MAG: hypothetical protein CMB80_04855 [Flammeovirgaceae bacterium]|nr:hypothetical protein [Flammeovirgaceae bacterium]